MNPSTVLLFSTISSNVSQFDAFFDQQLSISFKLLYSILSSSLGILPFKQTKSMMSSLFVISKEDYQSMISIYLLSFHCFILKLVYCLKERKALKYIIFLL